MLSARFIFFFTATPTTEIYTLSLHDALPIYRRLKTPAFHAQAHLLSAGIMSRQRAFFDSLRRLHDRSGRSEEHTSELQSQFHLVCRLLLEKKKQHGNLFNP